MVKDVSDCRNGRERDARPLNLRIPSTPSTYLDNFEKAKSVALKKSKQRHRDDLHATLSSSSTTLVVKHPMPDSSGEGRARLPEQTSLLRACRSPLWETWNHGEPAGEI